MPSKYSHNAVLARYSSLGLIDLPNTQHAAYLNTLPSISNAAPRSRSRAYSNSTKTSITLSTSNSIKESTSVEQLSAPAYLDMTRGDELRAPRRVIIDATAGSESEVEELKRPSKSPPPPSPTPWDDRHPSEKNLKQYLGITAPDEGSGQQSSKPEGSSSSSNSHGVSRGQARSARSSDRPSIDEPSHTKARASSGLAKSEPTLPESEREPQQTGESLPNSTRNGNPDIVVLRDQQQIDSVEISSNADATMATNTTPFGTSRDPVFSRASSRFTANTRVYDPLQPAADSEGFSDAEDSKISRINAIIINPRHKSKSRQALVRALDEIEQSIKAIEDKEKEKHYQLEPSFSPIDEKQIESFQEREEDHDEVRHGEQPSPLRTRDVGRHYTINSLSSLSSMGIPSVTASPPSKTKREVGGHLRILSVPELLQAYGQGNREDDLKDDGISQNVFDTLNRSRHNENCSSKYLDITRKDLPLKEFLGLDGERDDDSQSVSETSAVFPPDISQYTVRNGIGSPLAQVEMMLQSEDDFEFINAAREKRERGYMRKGREERIRETETSLEGLKAQSVAESGIAASPGAFPERQKGRNRLMKRLRGRSFSGNK